MRQNVASYMLVYERFVSNVEIARMILGGPGCRLQTCSCLAAEWFNSTFRAYFVQSDMIINEMF